MVIIQIPSTNPNFQPKPISLTKACSTAVTTSAAAYGAVHVHEKRNHVKFQGCRQVLKDYKQGVFGFGSNELTLQVTWLSKATSLVKQACS